MVNIVSSCFLNYFDRDEMCGHCNLHEKIKPMAENILINPEDEANWVPGGAPTFKFFWLRALGYMINGGIPKM